MPKPPHPCPDCGTPCHGVRCNRCAHAVMAHTLPKNTGLGETVAVRRHVPATESWWCGLDMAAFYAKAAQELRRMSQGSGTNYKAAIQEY